MARPCACDGHHPGLEAGIVVDELVDEAGGAHELRFEWIEVALRNHDLAEQPARQLEKAGRVETRASPMSAVLVDDELRARHDVEHAVDDGAGDVGAPPRQAALGKSAL